MRIWHKTTFATSCPLVTNNLGKTVKVPTRCTLAIKHLNTLAGMPYSGHPYPPSKCLLNHSSASNDVPVPLVSHLKEEGGRVSEEGAAVGAGYELSGWIQRSYPYIS